MISIRSMLFFGMALKSTPAMSMSLSLRPLIRTSVLDVPAAPNPRMSTLVDAPFTMPNRLRTWTPGSRASTSCNVAPGERSISCAVMTVEEAPVMIVPVTMPDGPALSAGASPTSAPLPGATPRRPPPAPPTRRVLVTLSSGNTVVSFGCAVAGP